MTEDKTQINDLLVQLEGMRQQERDLFLQGFQDLVQKYGYTFAARSTVSNDGRIVSEIVVVSTVGVQ